MPRMKSNLILSLGVEGGGADFYRKDSKAGDGKYAVELLISGFTLSDFEGDATPAKGRRIRVFATLEEALNDVSKNGEWAYYYPISIHPDYCDELWNLRMKILAEFKPFSGLCMDRREAQWVHVCCR